MRNLILFTVIAFFAGVLTSQARTFTHPCIPNSLEELNTIKANLDKEPWKSGFAALKADGRSQLGYNMGGPYEVVKRNPNENLWPWRGDMIAINNLARMWYFTGNPDYAKKARDILIAWATTHKVFGGNESGLDLGDYALAYGGGASILRGTWPGWTQQDTLTVQNYFRNVLWPATAAPYKISGPANKGSLNLAAGAVIAVFCDDTAMFDHVVDTFRNYPGAGLPNILPTGQMGETGRDMGHGFNDLYARVVTAEILWKQGVDVFSESDNRLLAAGEYHARNTSSPADTPFVPYGTVDYNYYGNSGAIASQDRGAYYLLQNAYKNRFGLPTPWIDRKLQEQGIHGGNFMFAKTADLSIATPPPADPRPPVSVASSGLTLITLGGQTAGRSIAYSNGVWTMTGLGNGCWTDASDDCQFAYQTMTGDCAMVARVTSNQHQAGLMIRDNLTAAVSQRLWIATLSSTSPNKIESRSTGWTATWGGSNWARRSQDLPPGLPYWLKIERKGTVLTSYTSQDGTSWSPTVSSEFGNLPPTVYVGLITSRPTTANTVTFDHVAFTGGTGGLVTPPAPPAAMLASGSAKAITLRWLPSFGATSYDILRSTTSGSGYSVIASNLTASKTSYVDTTAAAGTTYYYVARAKNSAGTSGNSPQFGAARLSAPLIHLAFDGTPNDSFNNSANAANVFDQNFGSLWFNSATTGWLQYDFGANSAQIIKRYTMVSAPLIPARDPKDWQLQGSNDGTNWTALDTRTNQTFEWRTQLRVFDIPNTTAYRYYRLNMTANNGDATFLHLAEFGLWGDSGRVIPSGTYVIDNRRSHKVMDIASSANGAQIVQQTFAGDDTQQWKLTWQGNGWYQAINVSADKALDNGGTSNTGANLVIQPSSIAPRQLWKLAPDGDGFIRIESAQSNLVAGVSNNSTTAGANLTQAAYSGNDSQQWLIGAAAAPPPVPTVPTGLTGSTVSINQINLSWTPSPDAVSYRIKRATVSGGPYTTIVSGTNTTSYVDDNLSSSTTYYYVVSALNGSGESANSAQTSATTLTGPPSAPTQLSAILGTGRVTLAWAPTKATTSYTVKRATSPGGPYTTVATGLTGATYADTSINHNSAYYYIVVAVNADGTSPNSQMVSVSAGTLVARLKFNETDGTVAFDSSGRDQHATLVNGASFAPGHLDYGLNLPATSGQHATLPPGIASGLTDFTIATWIKVNAFAHWQRIFDFGTGTNNGMFLAAQTPVGAGRLRFSIRTPSVAEQNIDSTVALSANVWTHVAVTRTGNTVRLYLNGNLAGSGTTTLSPADLGFTTQNYLGKSQFADPYLNSTLDDFRIYAQALSQTELTTLANPPAGAPTRLVITPGDTQSTLTWAANATTSYTIKRSTNNGGPYTTIAEGVTSLAYTDTGLTNGVIYYYVVSGANAQGSGPNSVQASVTPSPLRLHLKFDETEGNLAGDSSSRAAHATLLNGAAFGTGRMGNALNLDSTASHYATLPSGVVGSLNDFTLLTWVKVNTFATWQRIFDFGTGTNNYMYLTTQYTPNAPNNAKLRFGIRTPTVGEQAVAGDAIALPTGTWAHVAVVRSGNTVSLYVNGALAGSGTVTLKPADLGVTTLNYLGKSQFNDPYFNGSLDDFRIYSQALSVPEFSLLATPDLAPPSGLNAQPGNGTVQLSWSPASEAVSYKILRATVSDGPYTVIASGITGTTYTDSGLSPNTAYYYIVRSVNSLGAESADSSTVSAVPSAVVLHLKLDENSGSSATDSSGNNRHGTAFNSPTWALGRIGNALNFNGTNQYATLPNGIASSLNDFTLATWVYWNGGGNWQRIFDFGSGTSTYMFLSPKNGANGNLRFAITTSGAGGEQKIDGNSPLPTNGWHHVAVTLSGSTGTLYLNGVQVGQNTAMALRPADLGTTTQNRIGRSQYNDPYFNGRIDDFRLYAGALNSSGIAALAAPMKTTGLAATSGNAQIALAWTPTAGATHYTVRRASASGGPSTAIASHIAAASYLDSSVVNGTTYYYIVTPVNASGEGANSDEIPGLALSPQQQWRLTHFGNFANNGTAADAADPDGDGWSNAAEFASGTNPNDRASVLRLTSVLPNGNDMRLSFPTVSGKIYRLERSATLEDDSWTTVGGNITGNGSTLQITDTAGANQPKRFYRIVIVP